MQQPLFNVNDNLNVAKITFGRLTWIYIEKPGPAEVAYLAEHSIPSS
jgi:hypothetical protein